MRIIGLVLVRNEDLFIEQALLNILDFCDEIHVCDHGSTDRTTEIVASLAAAHSHLFYRLVKHPGESHELIEPFAGGDNWVFAVDGDELYDPDGLRRFRERLLSGDLSKWWMILAPVLHCDSLAAGTATGYLAPPCRSMVKLYNFSAIDAWRGPCSERLHGGEIVFRDGRSRRDRYRLLDEVDWDHSDLRCLHVCFLKRSSMEPDRAEPHIRENIADRNARSWLGAWAAVVAGWLRRAPESPWKREKYMRGPRVERPVDVFLADAGERTGSSA